MFSGDCGGSGDSGDNDNEDGEDDDEDGEDDDDDGDRHIIVDSRDVSISDGVDNIDEGDEDQVSCGKLFLFNTQTQTRPTQPCVYHFLNIIPYHKGIIFNKI